MADKIKGEGKNGTKNWRGKTREKKGNRGYEAEFEEDEEDGNEHFPLYGEGMEKDQGQEDKAHKKKHDKKGKDKPEKLSQEKLIAVDRLGDYGVNCFLVYFFKNKPCPHQNRHQSAEKRERSESYILDDLDPVSNSKKRQQTGEDNADRREEEEEIQNSVSYGFLECV